MDSQQLGKRAAIAFCKGAQIMEQSLFLFRFMTYSGLQMIGTQIRSRERSDWIQNFSFTTRSLRSRLRVESHAD